MIMNALTSTSVVSSTGDALVEDQKVEDEIYRLFMRSHLPPTTRRITKPPMFFWGTASLFLMCCSEAINFHLAWHYRQFDL